MGLSEMNKKLSFQQKGSTRWDTQFQRWGKVLYLRGTESVVAGRKAGRNTVVVSVRAGAQVLDVDETWRIRGKKGVFNIRSFIHDEEKGMVDFTCETGGAG